MLQIYGRANSSNVRKVLWIADEIGEPFERTDWGRGFRSTDEAEFRRVSSFGVVPVIDDCGFVLRESHTIIRYLATKHGRADLYPTDLKPRALVEMWMDWGATDLQIGVRPVHLGVVVKSPAFQDAAVIATGVADWTRQMQLLDDHLGAHGPYLAGLAFTLADVPVGVTVNRWFSIPFDKPVLPHVQAYYDRLGARVHYKTHVRNGTP